MSKLRDLGGQTYRQTDSNSGTFTHPVPSDTEHVEDFKLGIDSWEDTFCAGKNAFVE